MLYTARCGAGGWCGCVGNSMHEVLPERHAEAADVLGLLASVVHTSQPLLHITYSAVVLVTSWRRQVIMLLIGAAFTAHLQHLRNYVAAAGLLTSCCVMPLATRRCFTFLSLPACPRSYHWLAWASSPP